MFIWVGVLIAVLFTTTVELVYIETDAIEYAQVSAVVQSSNFWAYRGAVTAYFSANPNATGTVADGNLSFPLGYVRNPSWTNVISNGVLYTYSVGTLEPGVISAISADGGSSLTIGLASNGTMSAMSGGATFSLPPQIGNGAIVVVGN